MDFGYLMDLAKQNKDEALNKPIKAFPSQLSKPKKLERSNVNKSAIQTFLARREKEERNKLKQAEEKKEKLLSLRAQEKGTGRRVSAMLKRNKASNKAVLEDAKDKYNTAATLNGSYQPDTDDYGYVSKEAEAMYARILQKYDSMPDSDYLNTRRASNQRSLDLSATKARVKDSLERRDIEERESKAHRKRRCKDDSAISDAGGSSSSPVASKAATVTSGAATVAGGAGAVAGRRSATLQRPPPPGLDFKSILRLAAEKQAQLPASTTETAAADVDQQLQAALERRKQQQRPMTASQKKEAELERLRQLRRSGKLPPARSSSAVETSADAAGDSVKTDKFRQQKTKSATAKVSGEKPATAMSDNTTAGPSGSGKVAGKAAAADTKASPRKSIDSAKNQQRTAAASAASCSQGVGKSGAVQRSSAGHSPSSSQRETAGKRATVHAGARASSATTVAKRPSTSSDSVRQRPAAPSSSTVYSKTGHRLAAPAVSRPGRIESDSEEYDSEMDDFIDDAPLPGENEYSSAIRDIFGYDKSKFRDEDDDVSDMEADFGTMMREEQRSAKIARMEDDEELRKEMEHKQRKMAVKSKFW